MELLWRLVGRAVLAAWAALAAPAADAGNAEPVRAAVLRVEAERPLPLSRLDLPPEDAGFAGGRLATADNTTTGRFLGQSFETVEASVAPEEAVEAVEALIENDVRFIVALADAETTLALAGAAAGRALILNAQAPDDRLRNEDCRPNLLHVVPSRAMLTDAVAQFLVRKRWTDWFLIHGSHPEDEALADAYRRAAQKFGAEVVDERVFEDAGGARRSDSGHVLVQKQMPVFTQRAERHDVVVAADENEIFAGYLPFHTWDPRPVAGSAGLQPVTWHPGHEAWGANQFQSRFEKMAGRRARQDDFNVWTALRVLGEAATRAGGTDFASLRDYILGPEFELGAFKGQALTFRPWNRQLRQPVLLFHDDLLVSVSPQEGFLHRTSRLDTLGFDEPESACAAE
jgi:ABC transporter substrate binding protein (PQQ-dependent alcohol dehydrogenase system)